MKKIKSAFFLLSATFTFSSLAHEPEVTRESLCQTTGSDVYFLKVKGADFGAPKIGDRYVKVWREQADVDIFTIDDPLDHGGLNSGLCTCSFEDKPKLTCD